MTGGKGWKPLGGKAYGHIPHLFGSRVGPGDHTCHEGQVRIATEQVRDKHDLVIVQEKLDGSCVAVALVGGEVLALGRAGYLAQTSSFEQHRLFASWVQEREGRFAFLQEGERLCGEWLAQAHGTRYELWHEPFIPFDLMVGHIRLSYDEFQSRINRGGFISPHLVHRGGSCSVQEAMVRLGPYGFHGALDPVEGAVWRVERETGSVWTVNYLVKFVRADKVDGLYLPEVSGGEPVWNWRP
jgi:hypothetical protein